MELLEADFAQIEHINQILYNNSSKYDWACFDTHYLIKAYNDFLETMYPGNTTAFENNKIGTYDSTNPKNSKLTKGITNVRYNSFIVSITKLTDGWQYTFEVRNALWDGNYKITKSKNSAKDKDETFAKNKIVITRNTEDNNNVTFTIKDTDADHVRICFKMNFSGHQRTIHTNSIIIDNPTEYTHQYDEVVEEEGYIKSEDGNPLSGVNVTIEPVDRNGSPLTIGIPKKSAITDKDGKFVMKYGKVSSPGDYYVLMKAEIDGVEKSMIIHIQKVQSEQISIDWGNKEQFKNVWKGCIKTFTIGLHINNQFGVHDKKLDEKLKDMTFNVSFTKKGNKTTNVQTCTVSEEGTGANKKYVIKPEISFREYYWDKGYLNIEIPASSGFPQETKNILVDLAWKVASDFDDIVNTVKDENGPDWIFLDTKEYTRGSEPINITREITIAGLLGDKPCTLNGKRMSLITINAPDPSTENYMKVNIIGIKLINGQGAIRQTTGSRLLVDRCFFKNNLNENKHHAGCSIYMPATDTSIKNHELWKTEVRNCRFHNNKGNEIQSIGKTLITHSMFTTNSSDYLQQPEVKIVSVRAGEVTYKYNKSHIKIPFTNKDDSMPMNHSYAKATAYVDTGAKFNGAGPNNLRGDMTLPLYGKPWYNESYTRCCYYYPYDNVKTFIVCSPRQGYERKATGHASSAKGWVYYDGYYFTRLENSKGNSYDPWSSEELKEPGNTGIYDILDETEGEGGFSPDTYNPLNSGNSSKTSEVD